jgi:hypothetical protein
MKKILVALALAAIASTTYATVALSAHDMRVRGGTKGACQYCHAPHLWVTGNIDPAVAPLWNRNAPVAAITVRPLAVVTELTRACLSCHETGTNLGAMNNNPDAAVIANIAGPAGILGTDLVNDHPVGVAIQVAAGQYQMPIPAATFPMDVGGVIGCITCHDVHNTNGYAGFLVVDPATTDLCAQ